MDVFFMNFNNSARINKVLKIIFPDSEAPNYSRPLDVVKGKEVLRVRE